MKSNKTNPDSKSDKIQKKIDCILNNRARASHSFIDRIPKHRTTWWKRYYWRT